MTGAHAAATNDGETDTIISADSAGRSQASEGQRACGSGGGLQEATPRKSSSAHNAAIVFETLAQIKDANDVMAY